MVINYLKLKKTIDDDNLKNKHRQIYTKPATIVLEKIAAIYVATLVLTTCFHLLKGPITLLCPETIIAGFVRLMLFKLQFYHFYYYLIITFSHLS